MREFLYELVGLAVQGVALALGAALQTLERFATWLEKAYLAGARNA